MRGPRVIPVVIAAGGTGGHFFPAEALAHAMAGRGYRPVLMTDGRSAGRGSDAFADGDRHVLPGAGIAGRGVIKGIKATAALAAGTIVAARLLRTLQPGAIVGFGGYPCVPPIVAAKLSGQRTPIILHEQNAVLGRANRSLAKRVSVLALSAAGTTRIPAGVRTVVTGNPVRPAIAALADAPYEAPLPNGPINLLVTGGSLGAKVLSDIVPQALIALPADVRARLRVVQQARQEDGARVRAAYESAGIAAEVSPFFADMAQRLASAHLVIARAGASTTAELTVTGRPALLVPLPSAIDDHQSANAAILEQAGAAWVLPQPRFTVEAVSAQLTALLENTPALAAASLAARTIARADAVALLADLVEQSMVRETQS
ncbi:undecaprenyldiphospho-muramoylpentapeptide beta-N-acetylglucosaminyltransferase [Acidisoma cellulosilytica]|uniref:UDP-N-acetylglucosamine--N-acetylmuramyl-(pentapeptide) pyrophosphoryl-undecaprenol N-acetylglucosamine transferase n=1 Tax=Acidisoma cellulosilyticum TaxID=2802395 RepID=A0A963YXG8_9PROT|nr:undecaprenyldiphospho-muramoylpentapeptide beta-N-acetylglucosaminyltransferase [Acidisoma cellulosilyticum]MCB8878801.1 undecaprenyldiphospho-muramoylpentapeptide beta-N-acetylglucosaminyltransferase [Acidisoma cellulosilyticum]